MGKKDIEEKLFEDYNDVFADIFNVLLFDGEQVIKPDDLVNSKDRSRFKASNGSYKEQERDVSKWWRKNNIRLSLFGIENQTVSDPKMCLRLYGYDGAAYRSEYDEKHLYPVITIVLYFDHTKHWKGPKTLYESMIIPDNLKPYVNDYHMNLFEIAWLDEDKVNMFKSDFRIIADYFVQLRKNKEYIPSQETIKHVDSVMKLMTALTGDSRFEDTINDMPISERGKITMCKVLDDAEKRGEKRGMVLGEKRGRFMTIVSTVEAYLSGKKMTQKAACADLKYDYKEYLAAKRYLRKLEMQ